MAEEYEYRVLEVTEGGCGTLLLGSATVSTDRLENALNQAGAEGWEVVFQIIEKQRYMLFWQRERVLVTLKRTRG